MGQGVNPQPDSAIGGYLFQNSGSGPISPAGSQFAGSGLVNSQYTDTTGGTQNTQNTEYTIGTYNMPLGMLNKVGQSVQITAVGITAANANAKTLNLYFGSQQIATVTGQAGSGVYFIWNAVVVRSGSSTQRIFWTLTVNNSVVSSGVIDATVVDTATIQIYYTSINTAAAAASATGKMMNVEFFPYTPGFQL